MTAIQRAIKDSIDSIAYDISTTSDAEENKIRAETIRTLVEAYSITTDFPKPRISIGRKAGFINE